MATKNSIQPIRGETPKLWVPHPQKISIQPFPTPPRSMFIFSHLRYWIWGARSLELCNVGTSGFGVSRCRLDVAQPNKLLLWRGLALFLKQSTGLIKKTSNSLEQCVVQNLKRTAWFKGNPSQKFRESFSRENMRLKLWQRLSKSENGELMWLPLSESWFSWLMDFNHPQLHSSVPANYQLLSRFAASKNLHLPELRSFGRIPRSPFLKKKNTVKTPLTVRLSEVFLKSFAQISQLFYGIQDPTSYHQLTIILQCSNFFVSNVSLDPWVWSPKFTHEKRSQLFNLSHTLYIHHEYTYQYN